MTGTDTTLIIFDLDGVLVDSELVNADVTSQYMSELGLDISSEEIANRFLGMSSRDMLTELSGTTRFSFPPDFLDNLSVRVLKAFETHLKPVAGALSTLSEIQTRRCVASSGRMFRIKRCLSLVGMTEHFGPNIFSAELVKFGKPAPDLFLRASKDLGVSCRECIVIEDSPRGIAAAKAARMPVIGFVGASHAQSPSYVAKIEESQPDRICHRMIDLRDAIASLQADHRHKG